MPEPVLPVENIRYKTYVKEALVEALRAVFLGHPDSLLRETQVGVDFPMTKVDYPHVVVRFYGQGLTNAGIGHMEWFETAEGSARYIKYKHYLYKGDIEFAVYALSSYDRDLISDTIAQTLTMGEIEPYTNQFLNRIYNPDPDTTPASIDHFINLNTDKISDFGETQMPAPWQPEDVLVYQTAYRCPIFGEIYSRTPASQEYGLVEKVDTFPWMPDAGETEPDPGWAGPDGEYGTEDDVPDEGVWER